ncbi:murein DD-endopeptidase MepM/ murein hydrolase activator NlpD [Bartonella callosciuri]|uniref:Murein DD-endopeptidase MepM/ murein hydrolase activator NlpD n=1 Tax=Bartonella callosciuri TaxID=686223 RepID=A0A840NWQ1_9HYPH|nr:M23 family metallopeptidase [Bartonella callosciuri]MBB5074353.1 murein DD-endopeptidase MepM/ murein hydrolase activator NlpD [Bartonella callosciuri]
MWDNQHQKNNPGQDPALVVKRFRPARRQVSVRWLTGTVLTGITSCILMGIALFAALDGQQRLVTPPQWFTQANLSESQTPDANGQKSDRISPTRARQSFDSKRQFELSILQKKGDEKVIQTQHFEWIRMALAENRPQQYSYPKFDALSILASDSKNSTAKLQDSGHIYGAKVETKITLRSRNFTIYQSNFNGADTLTEDEVQKELKKAGFALEKSNELLSILTLIDPLKLENLSSTSQLTESPEVRIIQENVTVSPQNQRIDLTKNYAEDILPIRKKQKIADIFKDTNYTKEQIEQVVSTLTKFNDSDTLKEGSLLRIGIVTQAGEEDHLVRASIYQGMHHILTIALNDEGQFVESAEPKMSHALKTAFQNGIPHSYVSIAQLPTAYDALYTALLSHNISQSLSQNLIRLLATNIDMKSRITPTDQLEIFYAVPQQSDAEKNNKETQNGKKSPKAKQPTINVDPEIRYISATFGNTTYKYYRYQSKDGNVEYYDSEGKSSKPFLLRKPLPNGIFGSPFGPRKHPILGYVRMHTGVDWIAPKGSPIIAVGDGIVTKVETKGGYGNHTEIQHANGYVSSYSHQSSYAPDIKPGVKVQQGQIIGYVGTTGLATGPHCHFEIIVNGTKVDPMRIRLPDSKALTNQDLQTFLREKNNIDSLINSPIKPSEDAS